MGLPLISQIFVRKTVMGTRLFNSGLRSFDLAITSLNRLWNLTKNTNELSENLWIVFAFVTRPFLLFCAIQKIVHIFETCTNTLPSNYALQCVEKDIISLRFETKCFNLSLDENQYWWKFSKSDAKILEDKHFSVSFLRSFWVE